MSLWEEKTARMLGDLDALRRYEKMSWEEFTGNAERRKAVERYLHQVLERCLDLGRMLIAEQGWPDPDTNRGVMELMVEKGVLPPERLPLLKEMAGMRNILVHEYDRLDNSLVLGVVKRHLGDILDYVRELTRFHLEATSGRDAEV